MLFKREKNTMETMQVLYLMIGICWVLISVNILINMDKKTYNNTWINKYLNYKSKRSYIKISSLVLLICGILLIILSLLLLLI